MLWVRFPLRRDFSFRQIIATALSLISVSCCSTEFENTWNPNNWLFISHSSPPPLPSPSPPPIIDLIHRLVPPPPPPSLPSPPPIIDLILRLAPPLSLPLPSPLTHPPIPTLLSAICNIILDRSSGTMVGINTIASGGTLAAHLPVWVFNFPRVSFLQVFGNGSCQSYRTFILEFRRNRLW